MEFQLGPRLESRLESGLGLEKTKTGAGDKERAYLIKRNRALRIIAGCLGIIGFFFVCIVRSREAVHDQQGKAAAAQAGMRAREHQSAINMATMGAELEAHLLEESKEEDVERQFMFEERDYEEELKGRLTAGLTTAFADFDRALESDPFVAASTDAAGKAELTALVRAQNVEMQAIVLDEIGKFRARMDALAETHLQTAGAESRKAKERLRQLHLTLSESMEREGRAAKAAQESGGVARQEGDEGEGMPASEADQALGAKVGRFFAKAEAFSLREASGAARLPASARAELEALLAAAEKGEGGSPRAMEQRARAVLAGPGGAPPLVFGVPTFDPFDRRAPLTEGLAELLFRDR
jgi:hypothetical protein